MYTVNLIPHDLRREETILQIIESLRQVEEISAGVEERIRTRLSAAQTKLADVNNRIDVANAKIEKLKGSKKAIAVFAPAKYPEERPELHAPLIVVPTLPHSERMRRGYYVIGISVSSFVRSFIRLSRHFLENYWVKIAEILHEHLSM
jgi:hypothetical protein